MAYIGAEPIVSATRTITEVTATAGQTVFVANGGYTVGYIDVFLNGAQLQTVDFTATNGSSITLTEAAQAGDDIKLVAWGRFSIPSVLTDVNPSYTGTLTGGTGVVNIGSGQVYKDASGNVGIGTSSPATAQSPSGKAFVVNGGADQARIGLKNNTTGNAAEDGFQIGIDASGVAFLDQRENLALWLGTNNTERMRIDSSGRVTTPYQPAFLARGVSNPSSGSKILLFSNVSFNTGGHYNSTNGRFTAPIAGVYFFEYHVFTSPTNERKLSTLNVNGTSWQEYTQETPNTGAVAGYSSLDGKLVIKLNAGDYVDVNCSSGVLGTDVIYSSFSGFLVG